MGTPSVINVDLADVFESPGRKAYLYSLAWGDYVDVLETTKTHLRIATTKYEKKSDGSILPVPIEAYIQPTKSSRMKPSDCVIPRSENQVLKVNFVDAQQGDAAVIESPDGKIILVDGGDNQLFARYLAARFPGTSADQPREIDCILVTHGDADHFAGLTQIHKSEKHSDKRKRLFISPKRVYHNGLVKRPTKDQHKKAIPTKKLLGPTTTVTGATLLTGLVENLLDVPDTEMNRPFRRWKKALTDWNQRRAIEFRRLSFGDHDSFDFFRGDDLDITVLGPIPTTAEGITGLKFLGNPPKGPRIGHESTNLDDKEFKGHSVSHTINGHSIVFRLRYGGFSYLFAGDLNDETGRTLARLHQEGAINLCSEVFKVPHHGSADFSGAFLQMISPIVNVISSGDETAKKEYIHPRATMMGALGRYSRIEEPLIFVTELAAFFNMEGWSRLKDPAKSEERGDFFAFSRTAYGIVKTRTDGRRLLVYTNSGKANMKEAYCFTLTESGLPVPSTVVRV